MCPIKGLTDHNSRQIQRGLQMLGRIYKGAERTEQDKERKRPGRELPYFRVKFEDSYAHLAPDWEALYGREPKLLPNARLVGQTVDDAYPTWKEEWGATGLIHRCDGEQQAKWYDSTMGRCSIVARACDAPACKCVPVGRLNIILLDFSEKTGALGYFTLSTHSTNDVVQLTNALLMAQSLCGDVMRIPFILERVSRDISFPEKDRSGKPTGQRGKVTKSLLNLRIPEEFTRAYILPSLAQTRALPSPDTGELPMTAAEVEQARLKLGAGGEARRLGGEAKDAGHWTARPEQVIKLAAWAKGRFAMSEADVVAALSAAEPVTAIVEFSGTEKQAMAAVVAWHCQYDPDALSSVTGNKTIFPDESVAFDVYELACDLAEVVTEDAAAVAIEDMEF